MRERERSTDRPQIRQGIAQAKSQRTDGRAYTGPVPPVQPRGLLPTSAVVALQRTIGNAAVARLLAQETHKHGPGRGRGEPLQRAVGEAPGGTTPVISAHILQKLKRDAEAYLGESVTDAVVTVPAYFNDAQRTAAKEAGQIAGLKALRIVNEPTTTTRIQDLGKESDQAMVVLHPGNGTFEVLP